MTQIGLLILAAGSSSRMGSPKQLLDLGGKSLLQRTIETVLKIQKAPNLVILGAFSDRIQGELETYEIPFIINHDWEQGMGTSLKAGIQAITQQNPDLKAVLVLLCDQPYVSDTLLKKIIEIYQNSNSPIVACEYEGIPGVPALFDQSIFQDLMNTPPDIGARKILQKYKDRTQMVLFPEGKIDIDTPEDYARLLKQSREALG
ncbi:MAG: nucleotidyltransferase family protein [Microscillaceae bacterium]|nr:nucleotidyltransferase family protein [Microscillaceae bacterium]